MSAQTDAETREAADLTIPSGVSDEALKEFEGMKRRVRDDSKFRERVAERHCPPHIKALAAIAAAGEAKDDLVAAIFETQEENQ